VTASATPTIPESERLRFKMTAGLIIAFSIV
jgi:hypothetical protein